MKLLWNKVDHTYTRSIISIVSQSLCLCLSDALFPAFSRSCVNMKREERAAVLMLIVVVAI